MTINFKLTINLNLLGAAVAGLALLALGATAQAQQKAPDKAAPTAPAAKAEKKPVVKAKSACNAITEETACKADATCSWVAALMDKTTGKQKRKAYCKTKPKPPAKKKTTEPAKK
jgi:hypothetical protein